jgi:hypothetical protein
MVEFLDQNVSWLHVAIDDAFRMNESHAKDNSGDNCRMFNVVHEEQNHARGPQANCTSNRAMSSRFSADLRRMVSD